MDTAELKDTLKEQKLPIDEAVDKKIAQLSSDDVFNPDADVYITSLRNLLPDNNDDSLLNAFNDGGNAPARAATSSAPQGFSQQEAPTADNAPAAPAKPMTMAERIAALRGALYVPTEFQK